MSNQEIIEKLQGILQSVVEGDEIALTAKTKFEDFGISSFGMVQIVCAIEDEFDIEIPNTVIKSIKSVPSAVKYIRKALKSKA